jgi:hypothetical protein
MSQKKNARELARERLNIALLQFADKLDQFGGAIDEAVAKGVLTEREGSEVQYAVEVGVTELLNARPRLVG